MNYTPNPATLGSKIFLGDNSSDPDFGDGSFLNTNFTVIKPDQTQATLVAPNPAFQKLQYFVADQVGDYQVQLVSDDCFNSSQPYNVTITVAPQISFTFAPIRVNGNTSRAPKQNVVKVGIYPHGRPASLNLSYQADNPANGIASMSEDPYEDGILTYTPNPGFIGKDPITVHVTGPGFARNLTIVANVIAAKTAPDGSSNGSNLCSPNSRQVQFTTPDNESLGNDGKNLCGDPVVISTGLLWETFQDFSVAGRTPATSLIFTRTYSTESPNAPGDLGPGWHHDSESALSFDTASPPNVIWTDEVGGSWSFLANSDGTTFTPPSGGQYKLTKLSDHFELVRKSDNTKREFSLAGKITTLIDPHGETLSFTYDSAGRLSSKSSALAGQITFGRDSAGRITSITRVRDNLTYTYSYDQDGRLAQVTDFSGLTSKYTYVKDHPGTVVQGLLESITDPIGRVTKFTYHDDGRAFQQFEPGGAVRTFTYGDGKASMQDVDGSTTSYEFDGNNRTTKMILADGTRKYWRWDNSLLVATGIDHGGQTTYSYDSNGNPVSVQRAGDPHATTMQFDDKFNHVTNITPLTGASIVHGLDATTGDVTQETRGTLLTSYSRDSFGNTVSTANGLATYSNQYDSNGLLTSSFDLHNPQTLSYDNRARLVQRQYASGRTIRYTYDDYDRVLTTTDSAGPTTANVYDAMGRLTQRTVSAGGQSQVTSYVYDDRDRLVSTKDALNRVTTFHYDPVHAMEKPTSITDPAGRTTHFEYDALHRLVKKTDALGAVTSYTYDNRSNLTSVTDANGGVTSYAYDLNDRKIREVRQSVAGSSAAKRVTLYFYDAGGRLVREVTKSATGGQARAIVYAYDDLDRLVRKTIQREGSSGTTVEDDSIFTYANELDANLLTSATNGVATLTFTNEAAPPFALTGFSVASTQPGNPFGLITGNFTISRDVTGEIASVSKDGTSIYSKSYDSAGRLEAVSAANSFSTSIGYDGFGRRVSIQHSDGATGAFRYDVLNRISSIVWTGNTPISESLSYDLAGNITQVARENGASNISYDAVNQLISSSGLYSRSFDYDLLGNRVQDSTSGTGLFLANQILHNSVSTFTSDPDGFGDTVQEVSGAITKNYVFRADDRMVGYSDGTNQVTYYYDALGRRVAKVFSGAAGNFSQSFLHLGKIDQILMAKAGDGSIATYIDGKGVDEHLAEAKGGVFKGYVTDHLGSVLNGDAAGTSHSFGLFGEPLAAVGLSASSGPVMYGFTGREFEPESRLSFHRARTYNPMIGRWLSQDRLGMDGQDENFYRYVSNKALSSTDLTGTRIYFGDSYSAQVYRPLLDLIYSSSQAGQSLISKLDRASDEYYLWASDSIQGSPFDPGFSIRVYGGGEVCTNPNPTGQFQSTNGPVDLSAARVLAHELGHLTGVKDDGFMNMNNVVKFENPIMTPIDKQTRVTYP